MKINTSNKIPQWAIRSTIEGALQPQEKHPELQVNKKFSEIVNRKLAKATSLENENIRIAKGASPSLRLLEEENRNIKRANVNSNESLISSHALRETQELKQSRTSINENLIDSKNIRSIRHNGDNEMSANSSCAKSIPGGTSIFSKSITDDVISKLNDISEISREANRQKRLELSEYANRNKKTTAQIREEQKARKIGEYDPITGAYTTDFSSNKQVQKAASDNYKNLFSVFKPTIPDTTGKNLTKYQQKTISEISKYQLKKLEKTVQSLNGDWKEAAINDIQNRVKLASKKSDYLYSQNEKRWKRETAVPPAKSIANAIERKNAITDIKAENIEYSKKRARSITAKRSKKEDLVKSNVTRPTNNVMANAEKILKTQKNLNKLEEI